MPSGRLIFYSICVDCFDQGAASELARVRVAERAENYLRGFVYDN